MRKVLCSLVLAGALAALSGCGSGGGPNAAAIALQLKGCVGTGLLEFYAMLLRFQNAVNLVEGLGVSIPGYSVTLSGNLPPPAAPFTRNFTVEIDQNLDTVVDLVYSGTATFSDDSTDGLDPGATADVVIDFTGPGGASGSGTLEVTIASPTQWTVSGTYTDTRTGCSATFTIDSAAPVAAFLPGAPALAGPVTLLGLSGTLQALAQSAANTLSALVTLAAGTGQIGLTALLINDVAAEDDVVDGLPGTVELLATVFCVNEMLAGFLEVGFAFQDIVDAIANGQTTIPGGSFTLNPLTGGFSVTYDNDEGGTNTITGTAAFVPPPTTTDYTGSLAVTYNLTTSPNTFTSSSLPGAPFVATINAGQFVSLHGGATLTETGVCTGTVRVPSGNPLKQVQDTLGIIDVTADIGDLRVVMRLLILSGTVAIQSVTFNGVAVPPELFVGVGVFG